MLRWFSTLTLFFIFAIIAARGASSEWFARTWQSDDGLPDNSITSIAQASDGYLWVATQGGLVRFDGVQFRRLSLPTISGVPFGMIRALAASESNHLWLALEGGVVISAAADKTRIFTATDGLPLFRPLSIAEDAERAIWVGYSDGSACRFLDNEVKRFSGRDGLPGIGLCILAVDANKQLWFAKAAQIGKFENGKFVSLATVPDRFVSLGARKAGGMWVCSGREFFKCEEGQKPVKLGELASVGASVEPLAVFEDPLGAVWIGTAASGLFRFDGTNVARVGTSRGEIRSITGDTEGNIWVGTSGDGLNRFSPRILKLYGVDDGLPFETLRSVCEDSAESLWAVTQNGLLTHNRNNRWSTANTNADWPGGQASCVAADKKGSVWIGTLGNGLYQWANGHYRVLRKSNDLAGDRIWTLMTDSSDNVWIALDGTNCVQRLANGRFTTFRLPFGSHVARAMAEDASHDIWLGTEDGRLLRVHEDTLFDETAHTLTRGIPIRCLETTPDGSLWIGYAGVGLEWLKDGKLARIGAEQGLPNDFISQIVADGRGSLWFAGNSGIFEIRQEEIEQVVSGALKRVRPVVFGKNEGLPSLQANFGFGLPALRTREGRICFTMLTGLAVAYPEKIPMNPIPPPVTIEQVRVDGQVMAIPGHSQLLGGELSPTNVANLNQPLEIQPQHHELKIDFGVLSFASPENLHLKYRLEGYDQKWTETQQRSASYSRMPAGDYRFRVLACNNSGIWNETGATLQFTVLPFFWQTWWFRLGVISAFAVGLIAFAYYISVRRFRRELKRLEQETAVQKDRARIAKDLHDDLGANLSQIAMLSELAQSDLAKKPAQAHAHIDQIFRTARLLTRSLDEIVWAVNPRNDSLDGFVVHICQLAPELLRTAGIRPRLDMPMEVPPIKLAPNVRHQLYLALKEALHNVIKHANATEVWVRLKIEGDSLTLSVEDNGRGFETGLVPKKGGDGLMNLRHRMDDIGGRFEQHSEPERGTRVSFIALMDGKQEL